MTMRLPTSEAVAAGPLGQTVSPRLIISPAITPSGLTVATMRRLLPLCVIVGLALFLRAWDVGAPFESSDQACMPHEIRHSYGIKWVFAHRYGPAISLLLRGTAEIYSRLGLPMRESSYRWPVILVSIAQVVMTYPLLRRMRCGYKTSLAGALCCALLPTAVTDARFTWAWGYLTVWTCTGMVALWATLAYFDDRRPWQLGLAGCALLVHCLSNCWSFGLPVTLAVAWWWTLKGQKAARTDSVPHKRLSVYHTMIAFVLPCLIAVVFILGVWWWTHGGPLGRLLAKHQSGTAGLNLDQLTRWPNIWISQLGYVFGVIAAAGLLLGSLQCWYRDRRGLLAVWALTAMAPMILLADWDHVGYVAAYFIDSVYAAGLLGIIVLAALYRRLANYPKAQGATILFSAAAIAHLGIGTVDDSLNGGKVTAFTGIQNGWARLERNSGIKAASWYVRRNAPKDAIIMALHTNKGMEAPVAEFYLGQRVLAGHDYPPAILPTLVETMQDDIDLLIVDSPHRELAENLTGLQCVCTVRNKTKPVRHVYARPELKLPYLDDEVSVINAQYDQQYAPRHVPLPLPSADGIIVPFRKHEKTAKKLKADFRCQQGDDTIVVSRTQ